MKIVSEECRDAVRFILTRNILCGNALDLKDASGNPILFSEWTLKNGTNLERKDYRLDVLLEEHPSAGIVSAQLALFAEDASTYNNWMLDEETNTVIPRPVKYFPWLTTERCSSMSDLYVSTNNLNVLNFLANLSTTRLLRHLSYSTQCWICYH